MSIRKELPGRFDVVLGGSVQIIPPSPLELELRSQHRSQTDGD